MRKMGDGWWSSFPNRSIAAHAHQRIQSFCMGAAVCIVQRKAILSNEMNAAKYKTKKKKKEESRDRKKWKHRNGILLLKY